eukprot:354629-Chlamydomonas_euryale.AAC.2
MRPKGDRHASGCALHATIRRGSDVQLSRLELELVRSVPLALTSMCRVTTNCHADKVGITQRRKLVPPEGSHRRGKGFKSGGVSREKAGRSMDGHLHACCLKTAPSTAGGVPPPNFAVRSPPASTLRKRRSQPSTMTTPR